MGYGCGMEDENGPGFDFSQWHPLDHRPWQPRCRELYGGWPRHLWLLWQWKYREEYEWWLLRPVYWVLCRFGRHRTDTWWQRERGYKVICRYCDLNRPARPDEEFPLLGEKPQPSE